MAIILESTLAQDDEYIFTPNEKQLIHDVRMMLKDMPAKTKIKSLNTLMETKNEQRWSDFQLLTYIELGIGDINAAPPLTSFTIENYPKQIRTLIVLSGVIFALISEAILQVGKTFAYLKNLFN